MFLCLRDVLALRSLACHDKLGYILLSKQALSTVSDPPFFMPCEESTVLGKCRKLIQKL